MEKERYKEKTKNAVRNFCISTVILFIGIIIVCKSFIVVKESQNCIYSYNLFRNVNYTVSLKDNTFFDSKTLGMDMAYVSELVDKINMDFKYSLKGSKNVKTKYTYQIVASAQVVSAGANDEKGRFVWKEEKFLVEPKTVEVEESGYDINESVEINYAEYNDKINSFNRTYKVPMTSKLEVKLIVITKSNIEGVKDEVNEYSVMNVTMNLNESIFTINKDFKQADTKKIEDIQPGSKTVNKTSFAVGAIFIVFALVIMLDAIRKSIKFSQKSDYAIALNRILKNYGDIVAEIVNPIEVDNLNVIEVKNFDQLLDIEEEVRMPILFYEIVEGESGEFIIICDNMAYRYGIGK